MKEIFHEMERAVALRCRFASGLASPASERRSADKQQVSSMPISRSKALVPAFPCSLTLIRWLFSFFVCIRT